MSSTISRQNSLLIILLSLVLGLSGAIIQVTEMLNSVGITTVFEAVSLASSDKVNFALYLTFVGTSIIVLLWSGGVVQKGQPREGGLITGLGALSNLILIFLPLVMRYPTSTSGLLLVVMATVFPFYLAYVSYKTPGDRERKPLLNTREIAFVAVFSALTAILTGTSGAMLPSPTGGYTHIGDTVIYVSALLFGSRVGGLVGIIGPVVADLLVGYPRWFVTVLAHGSQGFIAGIGKKKNTPIQIALLILSGFVMATTYFFVNIFIKGYPVAIVSYVRDLFGQALVSIILGFILSKGVEKSLPNQFG